MQIKTINSKIACKTILQILIHTIHGGGNVMPINYFESYPMSRKPDLSNTKPPIDLALVRQLEDDIKAGGLKPGTKLPPQRKSADYLDINLSIVSRAFKMLLCNP